MQQIDSHETTLFSSPSLDFIAGVIEVHGNFIWEKHNDTPFPCFRIKIQKKQGELLNMIVRKLRLNTKVSYYIHDSREYAIINVRRTSEIEDKLIPALEGRLWGNQKMVFEKWRDTIYRNLFAKRYGKK